MKLPVWKSSEKVEQDALAEFIIQELDKKDAALAISATEDDVEYLRELAKLNADAIRLGIPLALPPVADANLSDFDRASLDVQRIRALFKSYWGKRNRTAPPSAEQIAAQRWSLSSEDRAKLIDKFQRKTTVSQR